MRRRVGSALCIGVFGGYAVLFAGCSSAPVATSEPVSDPASVAADIEACGFACGWMDANALKVSMFDDKTRFDFDSDTIKPEGMKRLKRLAGILNRFPQSTLRVDGYSDSIGTDAAKLDISKRRAENVARRLRELGVSATRFESVNGMSDTNPIVANASDLGRPNNRRVELHIHNLKVK